jgi:hypothetical protein
MKKYANAKDVLPEDLLKALQKHHTGMLWVPENSKTCECAKNIILLHQQGFTAKEIAFIVERSPRRVHQVLAGECDKIDLYKAQIKKEG